MKATKKTMLLAAALAIPMNLTACNPIEEKPCSSGSYPVKAADNSGGSACAESGKPIPSGYTTYEPGKTPTTP